MRKLVPMIIIGFLVVSAATRIHAAEPKPALWAVYYAWYETVTGPHQRWRGWSDDKTGNPNLTRLPESSDRIRRGCGPADQF